MSRYCVSLGASAGIFFRGHKVVGGFVYCDSLTEAHEVARASVGDACATETVGSLVFFWSSHEKYLADEDCLSPDAVVMEVSE